MSLQSQISDLSLRVASECKAIRAAVGDKSSLATTDKTSLVAAINELKASLTTAAGILDSAGAGDTTHTWSADKIVAQLAALKTEIVAGAPAAFDTLIEISNALAGDDTELAGLLAAVGNRVRFDGAQALTAPQQAQAIANIGAVAAADVGNVAADFVAIFEAGLL